MVYQKRPRPKTWVSVDEYGEPENLTEDKIQKLLDRSRNYCLWQLGQRSRTRKQLFDSLVRKGVPDYLIEKVLDEMVDYGYVNDTVFAEQYTRSRSEQQHKGSRLIRQELFSKGVDGDIVEEVLTTITEEDETSNAQILIDKKLYSVRNLDKNKQISRLVGMLARKGYSPGLSYQLVKQKLDSLEE